MKKYYLLSLLFIIVGSLLYGQKIAITGKVTHATSGEALAGVNILADKAKTGTTTKPDGAIQSLLKEGVQPSIFSLCWLYQSNSVNQWSDIG